MKSLFNFTRDLPCMLFAGMLLFGSGLLLASSGIPEQDALELNKAGYFEKRGVNLMVFSNNYDGSFSDSKIAGIELIHHGVRTVTNGDVRLSATPGQWDPIPSMGKRRAGEKDNTIEVDLCYKEYDFSYMLQVEARDKGAVIRVILTNPLPAALSGKAGFNLEFLPSAYFEKSFLADGLTGTFPLYPSGPMEYNPSGRSEPRSLARGTMFVLAPEDPFRKIRIQSTTGDLMLFDGRNQAQNGWFVVRGILPAGKTGTVLEWVVEANAVEGWTRKPSIAHSQLGYHPSQEKIAVIELDKNDSLLQEARLLRLNEKGEATVVMKKKPDRWGTYLRYFYAKFDFSTIREEGLYLLEYGNVQTRAFRIAGDVYEKAWHPTQDVFLPVQMDHVKVREAYRIWHGASHLDDALQAPVNYEHFDLYAQGPTTDSPFLPGEHIPGLNIGGWYDAGDYDIRTQTHYDLVMTLVHAWEDFRITRDETTIDQKNRYVEIHRPDGIPDILQQIEHGTLALVVQHRVFGHAIPGIIAPDLPQYAHLGDAITNTDNQVCSEPVKPFSWQKFESCNCDDRWAFTTKTTPLNYGSIAALAAANRALKGYNDSLADECLRIARKIWDEEHSHTPNLFRFGNTTGGQLEAEELSAAVELLITTREEKYAKRLKEMMPFIESRFGWTAPRALRAMPYMDAAYREAMRKQAEKYVQGRGGMAKMNPFEVMITPGGWAGNGGIIQTAITSYQIRKAFPDLLGNEDVFRGMNYLMGTHPDSDISFVSAVGTHSKQVAYGSNRADFTFIAGGIVPGVLLLKPDFPENKEDWPFLWGQNEYVVNMAGIYIYLVKAVEELAGEKE
jgi:hypothetical protein